MIQTCNVCEREESDCGDWLQVGYSARFPGYFVVCSECLVEAGYTASYEEARVRIAARGKALLSFLEEWDEKNPRTSEPFEVLFEWLTKKGDLA